MKLLTVSTSVLLAAGLADTFAASPDWDQAKAAELVLFYPGVASIEWVLGDIRVDRERHQGARVFKMGDACMECHADELEDMGAAIASGERMEPAPVAGKPGTIPVSAKAVFNDDTLFLRFSWRQPARSGAATPMDPENPMKIALMLDAGKVEMADQGGCWASCHADSRTMPDGDDARTKYVAGASLKGGVFYDLLQWRSGADKGFDGYVAESRVMEGGEALQRVTGKLDGDTWTVTFERKLAGGEGDIALRAGESYNMGVAIHDDHAAGRFHHVSMNYTLGLDAEADIVARRF
jgi:hypothetical protein